MNNTPFTQFHLALHAKMAEFAGYNMPIQYIGINVEHQIVRNNVGVFDVSHMGEFMLKGNNALSLIQKITTNDAAVLKNGQAQYSCFTNYDGNIIDDLIVYCIEQNNVYMLVVNASNIEKNWNWIVQQNTENVHLHNISNKTCLLAIQGPNAKNILQDFCSINLQDLAYYTFAKSSFMNIPNVLISSTGYTGAGGIEIYFEDINDAASIIWNTLVNQLKIQPIGLAARDTLRLEKGYCLYGNDINEQINPFEAGLGWITKLNTQFIGSEKLSLIKSAGVEKKLIGFKMLEKGIPRTHYNLLNDLGEIIGFVTSGTQSPTLQVGIGMGYIQKKYSTVDTNIFVEIRNTPTKAIVVKLPFV